MSLSANDIILQPIAYRRSVIGHLWEDYSTYSVEAITANRAGVYDFAEQDCMYFAVIKLVVRLPVHEKGQTPENDPYVSASEDEIDPWVPTCAIPHTYSGPSKFKLSQNIIGVIYLSEAQLTGCVNMGCCILPDLRGRGYGTQAVRLLLGWAFEELGCHRVQVRLADGNPSRRNSAITMLLSLGFFSEGLSRRALFCPPQSLEERAVGMGGEWKDVVTYAMLDTDWVMQKGLTFIPPPMVKIRWDELFRRHDKERSEMLTFEEHQDQKAQRERALGKRPLKRSASMETIRDVSMSVPESQVVAAIGNHFEHARDTGGYYTSPNAGLTLADAPCSNTAQEELDDLLHDVLDDLVQPSAQSHSPLSSPRPDSPVPLPTFQGHRDPFHYIPCARFRSVSPSVASVGAYHSEDEFHSSASSPLLPRSPISRINRIEHESDSEWEVGSVGSGVSVPRSASVLSSAGSSSSWDMFEHRDMFDHEQWETSSSTSSRSSAAGR